MINRESTQNFQSRNSIDWIVFNNQTTPERRKSETVKHETDIEQLTSTKNTFQYNPYLMETGNSNK